MIMKQGRSFTLIIAILTRNILLLTGQEKYRSLTASYYRGAHGCLILFDVTKESSFDSIGYWYDRLFLLALNLNLVMMKITTGLHGEWLKHKVA